MGSGRRAIFLAMASLTCPAPCPGRSLDWAQTAWYMASRQASMAPLSGSPRRSRPEICSGDQCPSSFSRAARRGPGSSALRGVGRDGGLRRGPRRGRLRRPGGPARVRHGHREGGVTMAVRSKADAGQFREKARSMYFSNETVDWFLENSSAAQMRCVANLLDRELSARERNKRERMFRRATFASQPQVPCPMPGGPSLPVARYACRRFPTASRLMPGRLAVDSQPVPSSRGSAVLALRVSSYMVKKASRFSDFTFKSERWEAVKKAAGFWKGTELRKRVRRAWPRARRCACRHRW